MVGGASANPARLSYPRVSPFAVMPGLVPGIHVFSSVNRKEDVDGRA
jgi:zinc D-Ala-D-Ala dipeptidase